MKPSLRPFLATYFDSMRFVLYNYPDIIHPCLLDLRTLPSPLCVSVPEPQLRNDIIRGLVIPLILIPYLSNCSGSSWRSGAQAPYRSRLGWSAGALDHVLSPHTGSFHLYITRECFALPFSTKSSHFATALLLEARHSGFCGIVGVATA